MISRPGGNFTTLAAVVVAAALLLAPSGSAGSQNGLAADSGNPFVGGSHTAAVYFVPLDAHAGQLLAAAVPVVRKWLPSGIQITAVSSVRSAWANAARGGELDGATVVKGLLTMFRKAQGGRSVLLMTVTSGALYDPDMPSWLFVFGFYESLGPQASTVFGTLPMRAPPASRERPRLVKMMLRYIGELVCGLPRNSNPRSVLYQSINGTSDLDRMIATLPSRCRR
jgi:hypothetical protein